MRNIRQHGCPGNSFNSKSPCQIHLGPKADGAKKSRIKQSGKEQYSRHSGTWRSRFRSTQARSISPALAADRMARKTAARSTTPESSATEVAARWPPRMENPNASRRVERPSVLRTHGRSPRDIASAYAGQRGVAIIPTIMAIIENILCGMEYPGTWDTPRMRAMMMLSAENDTATTS